MDAPRDDAVVRVKLGCNGRTCPFLVPEGVLPGPLRPGTPVIVESESGIAFGQVSVQPPCVPVPKPDAPVKILRMATDDDVAMRRRHRQREKEAYRVGLLKIRERGLPMKLTRVEQGQDGARLVFYFTAEGRIDFRELVRELAAEFRTRIEMRQIGVRDEARMLGGYGSCGRPLCCAAWLQGFEPVSIKMAKQQELSLNPWKLSGVCGRLKCCLRFELARRQAHNGTREPNEEVDDQPPIVPEE